jgi:hypothetical protein
MSVIEDIIWVVNCVSSHKITWFIAFKENKVIHLQIADENVLSRTVA